MSTHTPGPWFIEALTLGTPNPAILAGADTIGAPGYDSMVASVVGRMSDMDANARLIAAAPDLLEASWLEEHVENFTCAHYGPPCDCGKRCDEMIDRARDARKRGLAKAKGGAR